MLEKKKKFTKSISPEVISIEHALRISKTKHNCGQYSIDVASSPGLLLPSPNIMRERHLASRRPGPTYHMTFCAREGVAISVQLRSGPKQSAQRRPKNL